MKREDVVEELKRAILRTNAILPTQYRFAQSYIEGFWSGCENLRSRIDEKATARASAKFNARKATDFYEARLLASYARVAVGYYTAMLAWMSDGCAAIASGDISRIRKSVRQGISLGIEFPHNTLWEEASHV